MRSSTASSARAVDAVLPGARSILTPMAVDPAHPSPHYHNRSLPGGDARAARGLGPKQMFAVVQVPHVAAAGAGGAGGARISSCWKMRCRRGCPSCSGALRC
jgi:hypothetical protein